MVWGERKVPTKSMKYGVAIQDSVLYEMGFKDGDKILAANGEAIDDYGDVVKRVIVSNTVTIERDGKQMEMALPENFIGELVEKKRNSNPLMLPRVPVLVKEVPDTTAAYKAGLRKGDQILAVNGEQAFFYDEYKRAMAAHKNDSVQLSVLRGKDTVTLMAATDNEARVGFAPYQTMQDFQEAGFLSFEVKKYGFFEAIPAGIRLAGEQLSFYVEQFKLILSPKTGAYKGVGGFKSMGSIFPAAWDWESFWNITAFFSIVLAFMNLLPIPALDGGHVLFTLIEMITGRKPNQKFLEYAQVAGMVILFGLMIYANANDWFGWNKGR
jgi:regulator of sigma E protease